MGVGIYVNRISAILLATIIWTIWFIVYMYKNKANKDKKEIIKEGFLKFIFFVYIGFIVALTLLPVILPPRGIAEYVYINLDIFDLFKYDFNKFSIINILGNMLLFTPLVVFGALNRCTIFNKASKVIGFGILFSLFIEVMQYIEIYFGFANENRTIDITDIILNVISALIGFVILKIYYKLKRELY
ncbi:MAG: VanZ family protein [Clostridium sp.]|uniref:VanZ family protein n=1 Tax=Clostridium sp. TaxID=1506 RepID=UPI003F2CE846